MKGLWTSRLLIDSFHVQWFDSCEHPKTGVGYCFHFLEITLATKLTSPSLSWVNLVVGQYFQYRLPINSWIDLFLFCHLSFAIRRIMMLEFSQYLENYLWPNYKTGQASHAHLMSIVCMINEKFRERVNAWEVNKKFYKRFYQAPN